MNFMDDDVYDDFDVSGKCFSNGAWQEIGQTMKRSHETSVDTST